MGKWNPGMGGTDLLEMQMGNVPGKTAIVIIGAKDDIGTTEETLWHGPGDYDWPTTTEAYEVVSDSANDTFGGTGANVVFVFGLTNGFISFAEQVFLNGTTPVETLETEWERHGETFVVFSGSGETNEGKITVRVAGGGAVRSVMNPELGLSNNGFFTIPADKWGFQRNVINLPPKGVDFTVNFRVRVDQTNTWISFGKQSLYQAAFTFEQTFGQLPPKTDIEIRVSSTNTGVSGLVAVEYLEIDAGQVNL